jgi:hypothetical protein
MFLSVPFHEHKLQKKRIRRRAKPPRPTALSRGFDFFPHVSHNSNRRGCKADRFPEKHQEMMVLQKVSIYRVIVLSRALEILHVDCAPGKSQFLVYGDFCLAIRLTFCESIIIR